MPAFGLTNAAAYVAIVTASAVIWSLLVLSIRVFLRAKVNGPFGWDDSACIIATVMGIINSLFTLLEISYGLGRHADELSESSIAFAQFLLWLTNILYTAALAFSMLSVCLFIARITKFSKQVWIAYSIAVATGLWAVTSILFYAFACKLPHPWRISQPRHCIDLWAMYASIEVVKTMLELTNILAAVALLWNLRMRRKPKLIVVALFSLRLLVVPPSIVRLHYSHLALFSKDWSYQRVDVVIITQIVMHLSIILATIPCAKPFLTVFNRGGLRMSIHRPEILLPDTRALEEARPSKETLREPALAYMHWRRSGKHRIVLCPQHSRTVTIVRHDPEDAERATRRRSFESSASSRGAITRTTSFRVAFAKRRSLPKQKHRRSVIELDHWRLSEL